MNKSKKKLGGLIVLNLPLRPLRETTTQLSSLRALMTDSFSEIKFKKKVHFCLVVKFGLVPLRPQRN
jgi:hypothetical protein